MVNELFDKLIPVCLDIKKFSKIMKSSTESLLAIRIHEMIWCRKIQNGVIRYFGFLDSAVLRNVYSGMQEDGAYQITDLSFFEQTNKRGLEDKGYIPECIVVFGFSRIGKPLIVSVIKEEYKW